MLIYNYTAVFLTRQAKPTFSAYRKSTVKITDNKPAYLIVTLYYYLYFWKTLKINLYWIGRAGGIIGENKLLAATIIKDYLV